MYSKATELGRSRGVCARKALATCRLLATVSIWLVLPVPVAAVELQSVYTVEVEVDQGDADPVASAYRRALTAVLVRLTGSLAAAESAEVQALFPNPDRHIRLFQPGPDGSMKVSFNGAEVERLLRQTGVPVWSADRPLTVVWLAVDWGKGRRELIGADQERPLAAGADSNTQNRMLRERVESVAEKRGVPVVFPLLDAQDLEGVGFSDVWGGFDEQLVAASARYGATSVLVGRMRPQTAQANRWTWYRDGQRVEWRGKPEEVVSRLADTLAASDALPGNQAGEVTQLIISGINSVHAYGRVQNYMEGLRLLDDFRIMTVTADKIVYKVEIRGGAERLRRVLAASTFLVPAEYSLGPDTGLSGNNSRNNPRNNGSLENSPLDSGSSGNLAPDNRDEAIGAGRALSYAYLETALAPLLEAPPRN